MFITKIALPRRTFLRGTGAMLALPLLEAMVPAASVLAKTAANPTPRLLWTYVPNGILMEDWYPTVEGGKMQLSKTLSPLAPFKDKVVAFRGLSSNEAEQHGNARGPHTKCGTAFLTGARAKYTEGADIYLGKSSDQYAADVLGEDTPLRSLQIALEANYMTGNCDNGYACVYQSAMSWKSPTAPLPGETNPRVVFERLFGDGTTGAARLSRLHKDRSILDSVTEEMGQLKGTLGSGDQSRMTDYIEAVRDVERRIQRAEAHNDEQVALPIERPLGIPDSYDEHAKLMWDLVALALQADVTRVVTYQLSREQSQRAYPNVNVTDGHHAVSHHGHNPERMAMHTRINTYHVSLLAYFFDRLSKIPDGDGTLLDHIGLRHGSGMGDADAHDPHNLSVTVVGSLCGRLKGGRVLTYPVADFVPLMNLDLALLNMAGVPIDKIGDSSGPLIGI